MSDGLSRTDKGFFRRDSGMIWRNELLSEVPGRQRQSSGWYKNCIEPVAEREACMV
jgi:hypothetical protein